jgi:hypothetical protein
MKIQKYNDYIKESDNSTDSSKIKDNSYITDVKELITKTVENNNEDFEEFINSFIKYPNETRIEGLINESDIYEFYLKYRNDIDEILNDIKFFDENPSQMGVFSLYEYIIIGTQMTIQEIVKKIKETITKE